MAEERIDVIVNDKVDATISSKFTSIATGAENADRFVKMLRNSIAQIKGTNLNTLVTSANKLAAALNAAGAAQAKQTAATRAGGTAAAALATQHTRLATATGKSTAGLNASSVAGASAGASMKNAAGDANMLATALGSVQASSAGAATGMNNVGTAATNMGSRVQAGAARAAAGTRNHTTALNQNTSAMRANRAATTNLIAQYNDIGVSLAGGMNPLLVLLQQGSQIQYIASTMQNGWLGVLQATAKIVLKLSPLIALIGAAWFAVGRLNDEANADNGLKEFVKTLGLTEKEMKKLENVSVTMGDTFKAVFQLLWEDILTGLGITQKDFDKFFKDLVTGFLGVVKFLISLWWSFVYGLGTTIAQALRNIPKLFYNAGVLAAALFLKSIQVLVNGVIGAVNAIGDAINWLSESAGLGKLVGPLEEVDLGVKEMMGNLKEMEEFTPLENFRKGFDDANKYMDDFGKRVVERSKQIARDRLKAQAGEIIGDRDPTGGGAGEKRSHALAMVNMELDKEIARMRLLKDEREVAQRMDQIEQSLAQKKIQLNDEERAAIEGKVRALQQFSYVQSEMNRIAEEVMAPQRTLNATLEATNILLAEGVINQEKFNAEVLKAKRVYEEATDPLFRMNEAITSAENVVGFYGDELERANYLESVRQEYLQRGMLLTDANTGALREEVAALMARNDALRQQQYIQSEVSAVLDPILQNQKLLENETLFYQELERLRQADLINEAAYQQAKYAMSAKFDEMRLSSASSFFSTLADITKDGTGKISVIHKAAAVAAAVIDGFVAVQKAYASAPPPWNYVAAAAVAMKTGAQVAGILSTNVGSFATGGQFMVAGGNPGIDTNNINMNVTRGERVTVETPAQQRAADNGTGAPNVKVPMKIVNVLDPSLVMAALDSSEGEQVILNTIARNGKQVSRSLQEN